ncbi:MAG TPA: hypothetical protein VK698_21835 [Kofleriaceae bacterium]|nr:hypothetical protein [Kofleriaceae bacterium]
MRDRLLAPLAVAASLAALVAGADAASAGPTRVGLVVATRVNLADSEADTLATRLGEALRDQLVVDVIAGAEARRRLPPAGLPEDCVAKADCVRDVATRLDRDELLFLFLVRIGPRLQIDVTWADRRGALTSRPALVIDGGATDAAAVDLAFRAAPRSLLPGAARRPRARRPPAPAPAPVAPAAVETAPAPAESVASSAVEPTTPSEPMATDMPVPEDDLIGHGHGRRFTAPVVVLGAVSAAALATGVGFAVAARQDYNSLEDDGCARMACPGADARVDRLERRALVADIMFAGAGAVAITGLILYFTSDEPDTRLRVGASAGGDSAALSVAGQF